MPSASSGRAGADRRTAGVHRTLHYLQVYGRLKTDVTLDAARADMDRIGAQLAEEYPDSNQDHGAHVVTLRERLQEPVRSGLFTLLAAVAFVLLIGCVNVANLLLARAASRRREMAIRSAIGAGRSRIAGQALTESAVLALLGGVAALVVAHWGIALLRQLTPGDLEVLGADRVQRLVLKEGLAQAGLGLALGLTAAVLVMHGFRSMLYQVSPADRSRWPRWPSCCSPPPSWHASSRPGRAMRVDPIQALRSKTRTAESTATFRPTS